MDIIASITQSRILGILTGTGQISSNGREPRGACGFPVIYFFPRERTDFDLNTS